MLSGTAQCIPISISKSVKKPMHVWILIREVSFHKEKILLRKQRKSEKTFYNVAPKYLSVLLPIVRHPVIVKVCYYRLGPIFWHFIQEEPCSSRKGSDPSGLEAVGEWYHIKWCHHPFCFGRLLLLLYFQETPTTDTKAMVKIIAVAGSKTQTMGVAAFQASFLSSMTDGHFVIAKVVNVWKVREVQEGATCFCDKKLSKLG